MPLHRFQSSPDGRKGWAVWKVTETEKKLRQMLPTDGVYACEMLAFKGAAKRRLERWAVRVLMATCWKAEHAVSYHSSGKPYLSSGKYHISISHTRGYVALAWSMATPVGIDIEQMQAKAYALRARFMHPDEQAEGDEQQAALLHWSAKETLYKVIPQQEGTDFAGHLRVFPFRVQASGRMQVCDRRMPAVKYTLDYIVHPDYVLTVTC